MAVARQLNHAAFDEWIKTRPQVIQEMAASHPPDRLYRMGSSGHRCTIYSYAEDKTVTVNVTGEFNRVLFGRQVFGITLEDLTECELPSPDENVGDTAMEAGMNHDDVEKVIRSAPDDSTPAQRIAWTREVIAERVAKA